MKKRWLSLLTLALSATVASACAEGLTKVSDEAKATDHFPFFAYNGNDTIPHENHEVKEGGSTVYFTSDISAEGLVKIYEALGVQLNGKVGVKISTGENGSHYLDPNLIADLVHDVNGTIVECNTSYGGNRSTTAMHWQIIKDHGFADITDCDIMDEEGTLSIPVANGTYLKEDIVGSHLANYDSLLVLSHFKGHPQAGFGGAIKNISIGIASGGRENMVYINIMNQLSVDCDCVENGSAPLMSDIGILASLDPVALDQACVDLVYTSDSNNQPLIYRMESRNAFLTLQHGEEIGLGQRDYTLVNID